MKTCTRCGNQFEPSQSESMFQTCQSCRRPLAGSPYTGSCTHFGPIIRNPRVNGENVVTEKIIKNGKEQVIVAFHPSDLR